METVDLFRGKVRDCLIEEERRLKDASDGETGQDAESIRKYFELWIHYLIWRMSLECDDLPTVKAGWNQVDLCFLDSKNDPSSAIEVKGFFDISASGQTSPRYQEEIDKDFEDQRIRRKLPQCAERLILLLPWASSAGVIGTWVDTQEEKQKDYVDRVIRTEPFDLNTNDLAEVVLFKIR